MYFQIKVQESESYKSSIIRKQYLKFIERCIIMEQILITYYENNAVKLHKIVDNILLKFGGLSDKDLDDFYSLANEVFVDVIKKYDNSRPFDVFLYSCLSNKIKTEITRRNREKRKADRMSVSFNTSFEGDDFAIGDILTDSYDMDKEFFEEKEECYSKRMLLYLSRLSKLQREVLRLTVAGYTHDEIKQKLHISPKQYSDCKAAIHSYRNVSILF